MNTAFDLLSPVGALGADESRPTQPVSLFQQWYYLLLQCFTTPDDRSGAGTNQRLRERLPPGIWAVQQIAIPDDILRVMEMLGKPAATQALLIPEMRDSWIGHQGGIPGAPSITGEH
jgi:hypothetical protein